MRRARCFVDGKVGYRGVRGVQFGVRLSGIGRGWVEREWALFYGWVAEILSRVGVVEDGGEALGWLGGGMGDSDKKNRFLAQRIGESKNRRQI